MISIKKQNEKIRDFLNNNLNNIIDRDHDLFVDYLEIMMKKDQWLDKLDTIYFFRSIKKRKCILLQIKVKNYNNWITVSWRINNSKNPLQKAFRNAIYNHIKLWRKINKPGICSNCNTINNLQVDHKTPSFIQLTNNFLNFPENKNVPVLFTYHKYGNKFRKEDYLFKKRWQNYHNKNCILQWLCKSCNLSKKKYL